MISWLAESTMEQISKVALLGVGVLAAVFLFTPYEAILEGAIAIGIFAAAVFGFLLHPRRELYYVRTTARIIEPTGNSVLERDFLAVRVELVRLWLLFVPTFLAVAALIFLAAGGPSKFSYLNWIFSSRYGYLALLIWLYPPLFVILILSAWISERRVMRDAEACSARSLSISSARAGRIGHVSYLFMGDQGEYYGGYSTHFGLIHPDELARIVFYNTRVPEVNKIAMGFLFHRLIVLARGVTDLDKQSASAQAILAENATSP